MTEEIPAPLLEGLERGGTILRQARGALEAHNLCDRCLGRLFGKLGHGMSNLERGQAIRNMLNMISLPVPERDEEECWLCEDLFLRLETYADTVDGRVKGIEFDSFLVGTRMSGYLSNREEELWAELGITHGELMKSEINRELGKILSARWNKDVDFDRPDIVVLVDPEYGNVEIEINPLFIYGRYRKLERGIPQTKWPCRHCQGKGCDHCSGTGKMYETSVEEIIAAPVIEAAGGTEEHFHGMGREDIDAVMLGSGRPFILEIKCPVKRHLDLKAIGGKINTAAEGRVEVSDLRYADKKEVVRIKQAAPDKTYRVTVSFSAPVESERLKKVITVLRGAEISQRTPRRVAHRRADLVRRRRIREIDLSSEMSSPQVSIASIEITAQSGTYIKELMHGDEGRTTPSLAELLETEVTVESLDVLQIHDKEVK